MALTTPLADDAAIFEYSYTKGNSGVYHLAGAWGSYFPFSSEFANGATVTYRATDGSANTEIGTATYSAGANTLTRVSIITSSNGGAAVNWTGRTRILMHALKRRLALCATPPTLGQILEWDGAEWCPATPASGFPLCPTPPTDGQVLIWSAAENAYCPADFCALVAACMTPPVTCLPYIVYSNRKVIPAYAGNLYTIRRDSDNATQAFAPTGNDAPSSAIGTFLGASVGNVTIWNDQSGNGFDIAEDLINSGPGPQWIDAAVNAHPALLFSNFAGTFEGALLGTGIGFATSEWTVFVVFRHERYTHASTYPSVHQTSTPFAISGPSADPFVGINLTAQPIGPPTGALFAASANDDTNTNDTQMTEFLSGVGTSDQYQVLDATWSDNVADADAKLNGVSGTGLFTAQDGGPFTTSPADIRVGFDFSANGHLFVGWMAEIIVYNCVLTSAERTTIRTAAAAYYGISL